MLPGLRTQNPDKLLSDVARRVSELRQKAGLTQEEVAEAAGVSVNYWAKVELGHQNLGLRSLAKIAGALGVQVAELFRRPLAGRARIGRPPRR